MRKSLLLMLAILFLSVSPTMANWWAEPVIFEATYYADQNPGVRWKASWNLYQLIC